MNLILSCSARLARWCRPALLLVLFLPALACTNSDLVVTDPVPTIPAVRTATPSSASHVPAVSTIVPTPGFSCVTAETALNLRAWAGLDGPIETTLSNGELVRVIPGQSVVVDGEQWVGVELLEPYHGHGWVIAAYVGACG